MVYTISISILVVVLFFVLFQDIKNRSIHKLLPVLIFILAIIINYVSETLTLKHALYNLLFVLINIIGIVIYYSIKKRALVNPIDNTLGMGDIVFFIVITPLFNFRTFILFFIVGLIFSLIVHGVVYTLFQKDKMIPLAGYLALFLILNLFAKNILKMDFVF